MSMFSMFQTLSAQHTVAITPSSLRNSDGNGHIVRKTRISCNILKRMVLKERIDTFLWTF